MNKKWEWDISEIVDKKITLHNDKIRPKTIVPKLQKKTLALWNYLNTKEISLCLKYNKFFTKIYLFTYIF